jgi:hypothetical protein
LEKEAPAATSLTGNTTDPRMTRERDHALARLLHGRTAAGDIKTRVDRASGRLRRAQCALSPMAIGEGEDSVMRDCSKCTTAAGKVHVRKNVALEIKPLATSSRSVRQAHQGAARWLGGVAISASSLTFEVASSSWRRACTNEAQSGGIPEWPKGSDCKSDGSAFTGSNPVSPTTSKRKISKLTCKRERDQRSRGCSSMVERQPSKLNAWVRFPSPAPPRPL